MTHSMCAFHETGNLQKGLDRFFSLLLVFFFFFLLGQAHAALKHVIKRLKTSRARLEMTRSKNSLTAYRLLSQCKHPFTSKQSLVADLI